MKKKLLALLFALALTCSCLTACGDNSSTAGDNNVKKAETWQTTTSATTTTTKSEVNELVYSSDKVKIYYTGGEKLDARNPDGYTGLSLKFRIENGYDEDIEVYSKYLTINGISILIAKGLQVGKILTEAESIFVGSSYFEDARIKDYSEVKVNIPHIEGRSTGKFLEKDISFTVKV